LEIKEKAPNFYLLSLPFAIVNGVVWGIGIISLPLLAKTATRAGLTFAMINLGIAVGAVFWGHLTKKFKLNDMIVTGTILSFTGWLAIVLFHGRFLIPLAFVFGTAAASIFALASIMVTNTYPKELWDSYIAKLQGIMTFGTVIGLLITSLYSRAVVGLPFLFIAIFAYLPFYKHHRNKTYHPILHFSLLKPKMHFSGLFTGYFHTGMRWKHFLVLKDLPLFRLNLRWLFIMLAPAPVYGMYPLLMKKAFHLSTSDSAIVYAVSTAIGALLFVYAGKISKKKNPFFTFNLGTWLYIISFAFMVSGMLTDIFIFGIVGFIIMILSWSFISTGMNIGVVELTDEKKRGEALGVANSIQSLDNVVGGSVGGLIVSQFGYLAILATGTAFSLIALLLNLHKKQTLKN